ncbi:MurR/RpiR family transcriptional regulator [[Clostridium] clostridioforme]|nr:MurR/RpiR family transcriptional regulator [Enterocloster clostridioformis]
MMLYDESNSTTEVPSMNPFQLMEQHKSEFTQNDMLIYQAILRNPDQVTYKSVSQMAEDCGVSQPAISRFVKGLGYARYQDFRAEVISWLTLRSEQLAQGSDHLAYFNTLYQVLAEAEKILTAETLKDLIGYMTSFKRVYATGMAKSYQPAQLLEILMRKNRYNVHAVSADMLDNLNLAITEEDLLIVFSASANSLIMPQALRSNARILLITANAGYAQARPGDRTLVLPYVSADPETSSVSPVLFDIFVELLASYFGR